MSASETVANGVDLPDQSSDGGYSTPRSTSEPVDGGFAAWAFLAGGFLVEAVVWAFPLSSGVFLTAYMHDPHFGSQPNAESILPLVGPLSSGIIYCSGPVVYTLAARYPQYRRKSIFIGVITCWIGLFAASFAEKIWTLVLLQGGVYGVGGSMLYAPCISFMSEWFVKRRGLANGVIFAGAAVGGLFLPVVLPPLLHRYGPSGTLRILSIALLVLLLPVLPFVRNRIADPHNPEMVAGDARKNWTRNPLFWILLLANTLQGFAYFIPLIWLPTFALNIGLADTQAGLVVSLLNGFTVLSRLSFGVISDHVSPWLLGIFSVLLASLATFVLWGILSTSLWGILSYGIVYGIVAGGWTSLWTGFIRPIAQDDPALTTTLFGTLMFTRGVGNILSTPISTFLLGPNPDPESTMRPWFGFDVAGGQFAGMICYVGAVFAAAGVVTAMGWSWGLRRASREGAIRL